MHSRAAKGWAKHFDFIVLDLLSMYIAFMLAYFVRHGYVNPFEQLMYRNELVVLVMLSLLVSFFLQTFQGVLRRGLYIEVKKTFKQAITVTCGGMSYLYLVQIGQDFSRIMFLLNALFYFLISLILRVAWKYAVRNRNKNEGVAKALVILTNKARLEKSISNIKIFGYQGFRVVGLVVTDADMEGEVIEGCKIVANRDNIIDFVCREWVDEVLISTPEEEAGCQDLTKQFAEMGVVVHQRLKETGKDDKTEYIAKVGKYTVLTTTIASAKGYEFLIKRIIDILGGLVGCFIALIVLLIIGPIIYIKSPGPILFQQTRMGKNGRKFQMYKIRSMYLDAEERKKELMEQNEMSDSRMFKIKWDTRIIGSEAGPEKGIGNFIRKYSLDEWPQFYNILKGDMSLVGTRPPTVDEWEQYELHHRVRLAIKPGLTGLWQVSGRSDIKDFEEVVKLDVDYITDWTLGKDIKILLRTVLIVFNHDGAM